MSETTLGSSRCENGHTTVWKTDNIDISDVQCPECAPIRDEAHIKELALCEYLQTYRYEKIKFGEQTERYNATERKIRKSISINKGKDPVWYDLEQIDHHRKEIQSIAEKYRKPFFKLFK